MTIISSAIVEDQKQAHDQRYVRGYFEDHLKRKHYFSCAVDLKISQADILKDKQPMIESTIKETELGVAVDKILLGEQYDKLEFATDAELKERLELAKIETLKDEADAAEKTTNLISVITDIEAIKG